MGKKRQKKRLREDDSYEEGQESGHGQGLVPGAGQGEDVDDNPFLSPSLSPSNNRNKHRNKNKNRNKRHKLNRQDDGSFGSSRGGGGGGGGRGGGGGGSGGKGGGGGSNRGRHGNQENCKRTSPGGGHGHGHGHGHGTWHEDDDGASFSSGRNAGRASNAPDLLVVLTRVDLVDGHCSSAAAAAPLTGASLSSSTTSFPSPVVVVKPTSTTMTTKKTTTTMDEKKGDSVDTKELEDDGNNNGGICDGTDGGETLAAVDYAADETASENKQREKCNDEGKNEKDSGTMHIGGDTSTLSTKKDETVKKTENGDCNNEEEEKKSGDGNVVVDDDTNVDDNGDDDDKEEKEKEKKETPHPDEKKVETKPWSLTTPPPKTPHRQQPRIQIVEARSAKLVDRRPPAQYSREQTRRRSAKKPFVHLPNGDCGDGITNPFPKEEVPDKYWAQRRRLFTKFEDGIKLDREGWYSVTPEAIAGHISRRVVNLVSKMKRETRRKTEEKKQKENENKEEKYKNKTKEEVERADNDDSDTSPKAVILDLFCGCGGNAISFAMCPPLDVSLVIASDHDRSKLEMAAHNASVYGVDPDRIVFVEADALDVLRWYGGKGGGSVGVGVGVGVGVRNDNVGGGGARRAKEATSKMAESILKIHSSSTTKKHEDDDDDKEEEEEKEGAAAEKVETKERAKERGPYRIVGLDSLPPYVDAVFLSPPWGGMDYEGAGNDLGVAETNGGKGHRFDVGSIKIVSRSKRFDNPSLSYTPTSSSSSSSSSSSPPAPPSKSTTTTITTTTTRIIDGAEILSLAAMAVSNDKNKGGTRGPVVYFLPRNVDGFALGRAAVSAGFGGGTVSCPTLELEMNYLNGKLKTTTAYLT